MVGVELLDPGVDDVLRQSRGVLRREVDGVLGAVLQLAVDGVVLILDGGRGHFAVVEQLRVAVERDLLGAVVCRERTEAEEGGDDADHDDHDDKTATLLGHEHSEKRDGSRTNLVGPEAPSSGDPCGRQTASFPAYSAMYGRLRYFSPTSSP